MTLTQDNHISFSTLWRAVKPTIWVLLVGSAVVALLVYGTASRIAPTYEVHYSYLVSLKNREASDGFRFDGYYALQATDLFTATLTKWLVTPETIVEAYRQAGILLPSQDPRSLGRAVRTEKTAPQLVEVTVRSSSLETAQALAEGVRGIMQKNIEAYDAKGNTEISFTVTSTTPWTGVVTASAGIMATATFILLFFFSVNIALLVIGFRYAAIDAKE